MKKIFINFLLLLPVLAVGESLDNPHKVRAEVVRDSDTFLISASYYSPLSICQAANNLL